jgi:hypothetical protein
LILRVFHAVGTVCIIDDHSLLRATWKAAS